MSAFCDRLVTAPLSYTHTSLGAAHISRLLRSQVRYFKWRSAVCGRGATRSFFPGASAPHRDKNISTFQNAASAPESAADGCLATTNASGAQPLERFGKKGESSAPSVFHAFLGAICERPLLCCCVPLCSLTHRTLRREENSALSLSVSPSVTQVRGFFPLTFRVSSASGLFFTLVCSTYLLTSRVLVNVGFGQTWCLVECDSRLCLSEIFFFFFKHFKSRECLTLSCCIS